jgi:hypothetical protein
MAPILWVIWVGPRLATLDPPVCAVIFAMAAKQEGQTPQGTREAFEFRSTLVKSDGSVAGTVDPSLVRGEKRLQGVKNSP